MKMATIIATLALSIVSTGVNAAGMPGLDEIKSKKVEHRVLEGDSVVTIEKIAESKNDLWAVDFVICIYNGGNAAYCWDHA